MQENFEGYREELDQVKLTEESKRALVRSLQNRKEDEMRKNGRKPVRIRRVAAVAADFRRFCSLRAEQRVYWKICGEQRLDGHHHGLRGG